MSDPPAIKREETWDVESVFSPPRHQFESPSRGNDRETLLRRGSPPRFLGKKRSAPELSGDGSYKKHHQELEDGAAAAAAAAAAASNSAPALDDPDAFPIKFSLSHDYKDDASFSDYLKDTGFMGPSPRGSPVVLGGGNGGPTLGSFSMFAQSPLDEQGTDTDAFDFDGSTGNGGFPMPKLQMSPMSTPPRVPTRKLSANDFAKASQLESPPSLKKPLVKVGTSGKLTPPRFPVELIHRSHRNAGGNHNDHVAALSPRKSEESPYGPVNDQAYGGPTQHQSPGQTIYNVASKSVGSPPSPYQPYQPYPWQPTHASSLPPSHSTPIVQGGVPNDVAEPSIETSPEFNPPRSHLRGCSRSGAPATITVTARKDGSGRDSTSKTSTAEKKLDPITPSPHQHPIRQAVSDESASPTVPPTVHQPPRSTTGPTSTSPGGWTDSLHMAPLPPYVAHQMASSSSGHHSQGWGLQHQHGPPAMPSTGSSPGYHPYYSPYYQQQQQALVPDRSTSSSANANNDTPSDPVKASEMANWRKHHHLLHQFLLQFGHCNVPLGYGIGTHYETLHDWCNEQRSQYQRMHRIMNGEGDGETCTMTPTRVRVLTNMGFIWGNHLEYRPTAGSSPTSSRQHHAGVNSGTASRNSAMGNNMKSYSSWNKWIELLAEYHAKHGNVNVPLKYEGNPSLGTFVNRQRTEYRKMQSGRSSSLTQERVDDLNRLGFTWAVRESHTSWEDRFQELKAFRDVNGHCNVPKIYSANPSLGYWVNEQRFQYRRLLKKKPSYMTQEKIDALNGLEFKWSLRETNGSWDNWLKELREYRDQHGNIDVPLKYRHNQALGAFVNRQRTEYRKLQQGLQTSLTQERIQNLNDLGFKWAIRVSRTPWETRLDELKQFKEQHGHCNVPSTYPPNQPLAYWVFKQRGQYRIYQKRDYIVPGEKKQTCHMTPERIARLDQIGFEWHPPRRIK